MDSCFGMLIPETRKLLRKAKLTWSRTCHVHNKVALHSHAVIHNQMVPPPERTAQEMALFLVFSVVRIRLL